MGRLPRTSQVPRGHKIEQSAGLHKTEAPSHTKEDTHHGQEVGQRAARDGDGQQQLQAAVLHGLCVWKREKTTGWTMSQEPCETARNTSMPEQGIRRCSPALWESGRHTGETLSIPVPRAGAGCRPAACRAPRRTSRASAAAPAPRSARRTWPARARFSCETQSGNQGQSA